jgi:carbon-monoxide dehydrogenase iron sulfur subunit
MANKFLSLDPLKCDGCRECEAACSLKRTGWNNPALSSIRVVTDETIAGFYFPVVCFQCSDSPCAPACPVEAIFRDADGRLIINAARCIGCKMCVAACPFGAMGFDDARGRAFKCDLCGGDPECVRHCEPKALSYVEASEMAGPSIQGIAQSFVEASKVRVA